MRIQLIFCVQILAILNRFQSTLMRIQFFSMPFHSIFLQIQSILIRIDNFFYAYLVYFDVDPIYLMRIRVLVITVIGNG